MKRFGAAAPKSLLRELVLPVCFFAFVFVVLFVGLGRLDAASSAEELRTAEQTVRQAAVHCYAIEGRYPPDLNYLEQNYGVRVDASRYVVYYQTVGSNIMPQIHVFAAGQSPDESN